MPKIRYPTGFKHCSAADTHVIRQAWAMAHYFMWRGDQVMDWLGRNDKRRKAAWSHGYDKSVVGTTYDNYSPRAWFGPSGADQCGWALATSRHST